MIDYSLSKIHPDAQIDSTSQVGSFCVIEEGVKIGKHCKIGSHVVIASGTTLMDHVSVDSFSVLGGNPQDKHFDTVLKSYLSIGTRTIIREGVTIHRSKYEGQTTFVGQSCYLMTQCHIGHDCQLADHIVITNNALLAGHVQVESYANVGGGTCIHQFVRIGQGAMVGGFSAFGRDVAPFCIGGKRDRLSGLNLIGLRRMGYGPDIIRDLKECYRYIFYTPTSNYAKKAQEALSQKIAHTPQGEYFLSFFLESNRGFVRPNPILTREE